MSSTDRCGGGAAVCVLGALEDRELDAFRAHMAHCLVCGDECGAFQSVADALLMAAPQVPVPRTLRRRVLAGADAGATGAGGSAVPTSAPVIVAQLP